MKGKEFSYDKNVAEHFDQDSFGVYRAAREQTLATLEPILADMDRPKILDVPCGTGNFLQVLREKYPSSELFGLDLSEEMLEIAKGKGIGGEFRLGSALDIDEIYSGEQFDVICLHYVFGFVDSQKLLAQASKLLKPDGVISVVSSTWESFPRFRSMLYRVIPRKFIESQAYCPKSATELMSWAGQTGLEMVDSRDLRVDIHFEDYTDFYRFAHDEGWFTQYFDWLPDVVRSRLLPKLSWPLFPLDDVSVSLVAVLKKTR